MQLRNYTAEITDGRRFVQVHFTDVVNPREGLHNMVWSEIDTRGTVLAEFGRGVGVWIRSLRDADTGEMLFV
jgi:hypothetical protein